jgi:digeranylgeranylglycerophospholipid reductase
VISILVDIVGGGFGGLSTAITLKRLDKNIKVVVHEKHKQIGYNPEGRRCAEGYTMYPDLPDWRPPSDCVFNAIKNVQFVIGKTSYQLRISPLAPPMVIIDRQKYLASLGKKAGELGVEIRTQDKITSVSDLHGTYIIDASGCPSTLRKDLGFARGRVARSHQQTLENTNVFLPDTIRIFFKTSLGYYWIFPRDASKKEINVGIGAFTATAGNPKDLLESFKKDEGIQGDINYVTGGLIPVGIQKPLRYHNILFVGDAGAGTFTITGEGVPRAILSGEIAAHCIVKGKTHRYPSLINHEFLKWDLIGITSLRMGNVLQKIGVRAYEPFVNSFFRFFFFPTFFHHDVERNKKLPQAS